MSNSYIAEVTNPNSDDSLLYMLYYYVKRQRRCHVKMSPRDDNRCVGSLKYKYSTDGRTTHVGAMTIALCAVS